MKLQGEKCHRVDQIKEPKQIVDKAIEQVQELIKKEDFVHFNSNLLNKEIYDFISSRKKRLKNNQ